MAAGNELAGKLIGTIAGEAAATREMLVHVEYVHAASTQPMVG